MAKTERGLIARNGWLYLWVRCRAGRCLRACGTQDVVTARKIRAMVQQLRDERAWDLLAALQAGRLSLGELYDAKAGGEKGREAVRARLSDADLRPHLATFLASRLADGGAESTNKLYRQQLNAWLAEYPKRSHLTRGKVRAWLTSLRKANGEPMSSGTRRGYFAALSAWVSYLVEAEVVDFHPLLGMEAPAANDPRVRHESEASDQAICNAAEAPYRALFALIHATAAEVSAALATKRRDLDLTRGTVHIRGKKNKNRNRPASLIEPWALPILAEHVRGVLPNALLFPGISRQMAYNYHQDAVAAAGLEDYTLRDARHSWVIRSLRRGGTFHDAAAQLGHATTAEVHRTYARFVPDVDGRLARYRHTETGHMTDHTTHPTERAATGTDGVSADATTQNSPAVSEAVMSGTRLELRPSRGAK